MPRRSPPADPAAKHALTAASVKRLQARSTPYTVTDSRCPGFELRVNADGSKTFYVRYRTPESPTQKRLRLGHFPEITPEDARKVAEATRGAASTGRDRAAEIKAARSAAANTLTVEEVSERYLSAKHIVLKENTRRLYEWLMTNAIEPVIGSLRIDHVTPQDVRKLLAAYSEKKTKANHCVRYMSTLCRFAESEGLRPQNSNPAASVKRFKEEQHTDYLDLAMLKRLYASLTIAETEGLPVAPVDEAMREKRNTKRRTKGETKRKHRPGTAGKIAASPQGADVIRLLVATGLRREEALGLKWSSVNTDERRLDLTETKTGNSSRPLNATAIQIILRQKSLVQSDNPFVFPSPLKNGSHMADISKLWYAVRYHAGIQKIRLHDLRHTMASLSLQNGAHRAEVGRMLGHLSPRTTDRYAHMSDAGALYAADRVDDVLRAALETAPATPAAEESPTTKRPTERPVRRLRLA